jgi:predicted DNA-binding transcriptional regulator AlpA
MSEKRLLTIGQFAQYTGYSKGSVYNLISKGVQLPAMVKFPGKGSRAVIRFDKHTLDTWITEQAKGGEAHGA